MPDNEILRLVAQFHAALDKHDARAMKRLIDSYGRVYSRLQDKITLLTDAIEADNPTRGELVRMARYKDLIRQTEAELTDYQVILRNEIQGVSSDAIAFAGRDNARMLRAMGITGGFNRLPTATIKTLLGFLDESSPLYERIGMLAKANTQAVADALIEGVALGQNPRVTARTVRTLFTENLGSALTDALRMTRTVQIYSYREASRANYVANSDIVDGWYWYTALDDRTCASCVALHGSGPYPLDEPLNDHYNGRCTMIPAVTGFGNPIEQGGKDYFDSLNEGKQRDLLGKEKYEAYKGGAFEFKDLSTTRADAVYGDMRVETPLWELLGAEPPLRTK
jgi:SPP1 gp7 family putative phage head morphogenesis protein